MLCRSKAYSSSFVLYRLLDPSHSCAKLTAAAEGQKQLTPEPCSLNPCPPLMHTCVLEHPTATLQLRLWLVPSYQVIKIKKSSVMRHSHSRNMDPLQSKVNLAFQWHARHQSLQEDFSLQKLTSTPCTLHSVLLFCITLPSLFEPNSGLSQVSFRSLLSQGQISLENCSISLMYCSVLSK